MPEAALILAVVLIVAIVAVVVLLWGKGKAAFEACEKQLREHGYVVDYPRERHRGTITRVWGRYGKPVPFYLHFSNRDPVASLAGRAGIADLRMGEPAFDAAFFVRSNRPEWAREFLTPERCARLARFRGIQFSTSAIGNLLTPEYWPDQRNRDARDLWMLRIDGKLEGAVVEPHVALARELSSALEAFCAGKSHAPEDVVAGMLEGR